MSVREEDNGVHSNGWTCGHCPSMPARRPPHFHKYVNASKALAHVLRLKGQSVSACKGNIPYAKKVQYKALYNAGRLKSKQSKRRKEELDYDITESHPERLQLIFLHQHLINAGDHLNTTGGEHHNSIISFPCKKE